MCSEKKLSQNKTNVLLKSFLIFSLLREMYLPSAVWFFKSCCFSQCSLMHFITSSIRVMH
jgi:hypothetical protein